MRLDVADPVLIANNAVLKAPRQSTIYRASQAAPSGSKREGGFEHGSESQRTHPSSATTELALPTAGRSEHAAIRPPAQRNQSGHSRRLLGTPAHPPRDQT